MLCILTCAIFGTRLVLFWPVNMSWVCTDYIWNASRRTCIVALGPLEAYRPLVSIHLFYTPRLHMRMRYMRIWYICIGLYALYEYMYTFLFTCIVTLLSHASIRLLNIYLHLIVYISSETDTPPQHISIPYTLLWHLSARLFCTCVYISFDLYVYSFFACVQVSFDL